MCNSDSDVKMGVSRPVIGRSFIKNERNDFGIGVGIQKLAASRPDGLDQRRYQWLRRAHVEYRCRR